MDEPQHPHELLAAFAADRCGRVADGVSVFARGLFGKVLLGITEQLGIYCDCVPGARLRLGRVTLREGTDRTYLFAALTDRGGALRLRDAMHIWTAPGDIPVDFVEQTNARRWRFLDRYNSGIVAPLMGKMHDRLAAYYAERLGATFNFDLIRFLEGVDCSYLCIEIDTRGAPSTRDDAARYRVQ